MNEQRHGNGEAKLSHGRSTTERAAEGKEGVAVGEEKKRGEVRRAVEESAVRRERSRARERAPRRWRASRMATGEGGRERGPPECMRWEEGPGGAPRGTSVPGDMPKGAVRVVQNEHARRNSGRTESSIYFLKVV